MLNTKFPASKSAATVQAQRAPMSQEPDKRVCSVLATDQWLPLFASVSDRFMHHPTREEKLHDSERGLCLPEPYYSMPPSLDRYRRLMSIPVLRVPRPSSHHRQLQGVPVV